MKSKVTKKAKEEYDEMKEVICLEIKEAMKFSTVSIALDIWKDTTSGFNHLGATAHYFKSDSTGLKMVSRALKLWPLDANSPKDAENLNHAVNGILSEYDLFDVKDDIVFLSDRGGNLVNSLDGYKRQNCLNHLINNLVQNSIEKTLTVKNMKFCVNRIVKYFKSSGRNANLSNNLISFIKTRWNSFYSVLDTFYDLFDEIRMNIPENNTDILSLFHKLNRQKILHVKNFLEPFYRVTKFLESDEEVTATKVLPCYEILISHLAASENDITEVKDMKRNAQKYFDQNRSAFPKNFEYWAFFDPRYRLFTNFKTVGSTEQLLRDFRMYAMNNFDDPIEGDETVEINNNSQAHQSSSMFSQFEDPIRLRSTSSIDDEINLYLQLPFDKSDNILNFWWKHREQLPKLFKFFCCIAPVPVTSASVERLFSNCANIITAKRNRLSNENVDCLAFLHKNSKH